MFIGSVFNLLASATILKVGGLPFVDGIVGGAWAAFLGNVLAMMLSNLPIAVVAGSGPNLTVAYTLALPTKFGGLGGYAAAMTCCMVSGVCIAALTAVGAISKIETIMPESLKLGICVGIGLLLAFVGMQEVGMVVNNPNGLLEAGDFAHEPRIWLTLGALMLLTLMTARKIKGATMVCMILVTIVDWSFLDGWPSLKVEPFKFPHVPRPDFTLLRVPKFWIQVLAMVMLVVFDAMGCILGMAKLAGRVDPATGTVEGGNGFFYAVGLGSSLAAVFGVSPLVVAGSSAAGIMDGARTGLSTFVCGVLYVAIGLPLAPTLAAMPQSATSFVLIYVGCSFSAEAAGIKWDDPIAAVPAFLCIISQPFLFSIADGIYIGLAAAAVLSLLSGRMFRRVQPNGGALPRNRVSSGPISFDLGARTISDPGHPSHVSSGRISFDLGVRAVSDPGDRGGVALVEPA